MKLIVGLGNPGKKYEKTRHNIGFLAMDKLEQKYNLTFKEEKNFNSLVAVTIVDGEKVFFLKPLTYMNLSGEAVGKITKYYKINDSDLVVIHDDMDLPFASLRLREKGSAGGHNGIKNIILNLATQEFKRIRVGISDHGNEDAVDYVLGVFSRSELEELDKTFDLVSHAVDEFIKGDPFEVIMGRYNSHKQ